MSDLISRQAAIDAVEKESQVDEAYGYMDTKSIIDLLCDLPSAQPTLYGYNIEHLKLIVAILRKEDLPPERVKEALTDIGKIVEMVQAEYEDMMRKTVEQYVSEKGDNAIHD